VVVPNAPASPRAPKSTVCDNSSNEVLVTNSPCSSKSPECDGLNNNEIVTLASSSSESAVCSGSNVPYDIGNFLDKHVDDYTKY
jgi:hypothetical protein